MSTNTILSFGAFGILTLLWLGFGAALVFNQTILDTVWQSLRGLPLILVIGLGFATIYTFFPKQS
jgi:uncharacterized membrane protein